jgi:cyanophycin synthetase
MRRSRKLFYSTMWQHAAQSVGIRYTEAPDGTGELDFGGRTLRVRENWTSLEKQRTLQLVSNKARVRSILVNASLPVPKQLRITTRDFSAALTFLNESRGKIVIKPAADTGGGAGVSTNVYSIRQLRTALAWARAYGPRILLEEQIEGDCYRVLIMDGNVIDVVLRMPVILTGDGRSTIRQLIRQENNLRRLTGIACAQMLVRIDPDLRNTLAVQGLYLSSRLTAGKRVLLKRVINENRTADNRAANGILCPAIIETARRAAAILETRLAGIDLICADPDTPLERAGGAIIEVNVNPGLYYHYSPERAHFPITQSVLTNYFFEGTMSPSPFAGNPAKDTLVA